MVLVLNMSDMAERQGIQIDREVLARELGMPVLATVGVRGDGASELLAWLDSPAAQALKAPQVPAQEAVALDASALDAQTQVIRTHQQVHRLMGLTARARTASSRSLCRHWGVRTPRRRAPRPPPPPHGGLGVGGSARLGRVTPRPARPAR
eukprot:gene45732-56985_t